MSYRVASPLKMPIYTIIKGSLVGYPSLNATMEYKK